MFRRIVSSNATASVGLMGAVASVSARSLTYKPRLRDYKFLLEDVLDSYTAFKDLGREDVTPDLVDTMLEECSKVCVNSLFPSYLTADDEGGCKLSADGTVTTPKGFKEAYDAVTQGGWTSISSPEKFGGQGMPQEISLITREMMGTANWSFGMYPGLTAGAVNTLMMWGSEEQQNTYLPKMVSGEWSGTMCLTEAQCGTDLGQVKSKAEPLEDGTYKISGTKIFISAGDHDLAENIIHIVLARLPDAKPGTRGLSLFLVPRNIIKSDGSLESKKNVTCIALEHKMGIKGSATCQIAFDGSIGYLIGKPNDGLKEMFTFMNTARVGVALEGISHAELAFQNALQYARERGSMRSLSGKKDPSKPNDYIIHHPNVRMQLLFAKSIIEGGRALIIDLARTVNYMDGKPPSSPEWEKIDHEIGFYTPIAKACLSEWGLEASSRCMQVWGGHGYIKGNGMEQIVRDARIATIYEGTTGVQSLDFIGRKVLKAKTNEVARFGSRVNTLVRPYLIMPGMNGKHARQLWLMQKQWRMAIMRIKINSARNLDTVGAASEDLLMYSGYLVLGYYWLRMSLAAQKKISAGKDTDGFYQSKVDTCNFYFDHVLPRCQGHYDMMLRSASSLMDSKESTWDLE